MTVFTSCLLMLSSSLPFVGPSLSPPPPPPPHGGARSSPGPRLSAAGNEPEISRLGFIDPGCLKNRETLTSSIAWAYLATSSRKQNRFVACRFRAVVLNIPTLDFGHDSPLLLERHALASNAIHDPKRRTEIRGPCGSEFLYRLPEMTFCKEQQEMRIENPDNWVRCINVSRMMSSIVNGIWTSRYSVKSKLNGIFNVWTRRSQIDSF